MCKCWKRHTLYVQRYTCVQVYSCCYHFNTTVNALWSKDYQAPVTTRGVHLITGNKLYLTIKIGRGTCTKTYCYPTTQSRSGSSCWRLKQQTHMSLWQSTMSQQPYKRACSCNCYSGNSFWLLLTLRHNHLSCKPSLNTEMIALCTSAEMSP